MEKLGFLVFLITLFLLQFCNPSLVSSDYVSPDKYFINCGSKSNVNDGLRTFVGDVKSGYTAGKSKPIKEKNPLTSSPLYQTARKCREACAYELDIAEFGRYFVRLHFLAFESGDTNLLDGLFNVSTSNKYLLLSNFGIQNSSNSPVIEEFLLTIDESKFRIYFVPVGASFAFVNAVEVFLAPPNLTTDDAFHVWGKNVNYHGLLSHALHTIHRINVGGETKNDLLGRNWMSDDKYLYEPGLVKKCNYYDGRIDYSPLEEGNVHIAPDFVYLTCKKLEVEEVSNFSNVTWRFNVRKNIRHLVRMHFCDIVAMASGLFSFNLYINTNFSYLVDPNSIAVPYYHDFVVDSDSSGFLRIGIGLDVNSTKKKAILNGLEIMQLTEETSFIPHLSESKDYKLIIVSSVCSLASVACLVVIVLLCYKCKKPKNVRTVNSSHVVLWGVRIPRCKMTSETSSVSSLHNCNLKLKMAFSDILYATQNFDAKLLIGEGGFGKVYKGTLRSGLKVAVKRSDPNHGQGLPEFQTEIMILSKIRHRHLVSLVGYCDEGLEMILVYEFMEKGALKDHLYGSGNSEMISSTIPKLSWKQRLEICIGSARGLHYLHTGSAGGIIHRDIKSTNILLDEHYTAKVADFGLSRSGQLDPDHFSVGIKGSFGYLDPEYLTSLQFTEKSDVYSFGVVLLEVFCGRPAIVNTERIEEVNLAEWGMYWQNKGQLETIMEPSLVGEISPNSLRKFGEIVENCLKRNGADRPAMIDVLWDLEYALQFQIAEFPREPQDGTTTNALLELPTLTGFPSYSIQDEEDDRDILLNYGLTIASKGQERLVKELDGILQSYSSFTVQKVAEKAKKGEALDGSVAMETSPADLKSEKKRELMEERSAAYWTTLAPNVEDYSGTTAKMIAAGSGQLIKGILWCGDVTVDRLKWGNEVMKKRMSPGSEKEVSKETLKRIRRVKRVSKMTEKVANGVLSGVVKVSGFFTSSVANSKAGKKFFGLLPGEIILASLDGFSKVCDAVEVSGKNVMSTSSTVTTELVNHRYGEQASKATSEGLDAAGHAMGAAWAAFKIRKAFNPKSVLKPTTLAKSAAKAAASEKKKSKKSSK